MKKTIIQSTPFGPVAVLWSPARGKAKVDRVLLSHPGLPADRIASRLFPNADRSTCAEINAVCSGIVASLNGKRIRFFLSLTHPDHCPPFQQAVLRAEHGIPWGSVSTYGLLAVHLGRPSAARAVGNALAKNPFPVIVPCHRAILSDRTLGGYQEGLEMKRTLLENECVMFDPNGKVVVETIHYDRKQRQ